VLRSAGVVFVASLPEHAVPPQSVIHQHIHQLFHQAFGEPDNTLGRDDHWALRPTHNGVAIHVLVNGTGELPAVWVFDPHAQNDGVIREIVKTQQDIERIINVIQARLKSAAEDAGRLRI
jgi:hypothetical protein